MKQPHPFIPRSTAYALLLLAAAACSNENELTENPHGTQRPEITLTALLPGADPTTRVDYNDPEEGNVAVTWVDGDDIALFGQNAEGKMAYSLFNLIAGTGTNQGEFKGTPPADADKCIAFYPTTHIELGDDGLAGVLTGQTQTTNSSMTHLSEYNFMAATVDAEGKPVRFEQLVAMMRFDATLDGYNAETDGAPILLSITRAQQGDDFDERIRATTDDTPYSGHGNGAVHLLLNDITLGADNKLKAYMMVPQIKVQTGNNLIVTVTCAKGTTYRYNAPQATSDIVYQKGKRYRATLSLTKVVEPAESVFTDQTTASSVLDGDGSKATPYLIQTAADLKKLVEDVKNVDDPDGLDGYNGKYIKLMTDIRVEASTWTPIGCWIREEPNKETPFKGTFLGNGHTISGALTGDVPEFGFFGIIVGGSVHNLHILADVTCKFTESITIGGVVGQLQVGLLMNCSNSGKISIIQTESISYVGGIAGVSGGSLIGCTNRGVISGGNSKQLTIGGVVAQMVSGAGADIVFLPNVLNCVNYGAVGDASERVVATTGGIVGSMMGQDNVNFADCVNYGTVTGATTTDTNTTGGVIGALLVFDGTVTMHNCFNKGAVNKGTTVGTGKMLGNGGLVGVATGYGVISIFNCCADTGSDLTDLIGLGEESVSITPCPAPHKHRSPVVVP